MKKEKEKKEIKFNPDDYGYLDKYFPLEGWMWEFIRRNREYRWLYSEIKKEYPSSKYPQINKHFDYLLKEFGMKSTMDSYSTTLPEEHFITDTDTDFEDIKSKYGRSRNVTNGFPNPDIKYNEFKQYKPSILIGEIVKALIPPSAYKDFTDFSENEFNKEFNKEQTVERLCEAINNDRYQIDVKATANSVEWLNKLIRVPELYDNIRRKKGILKKLHKYTKDRIKDFKSYYDNEKNKSNLKRLNRYLLEIFYPQECPNSPSYWIRTDPYKMPQHWINKDKELSQTGLDLHHGDENFNYICVHAIKNSLAVFEMEDTIYLGVSKYAELTDVKKKLDDIYKKYITPVTSIRRRDKEWFNYLIAYDLNEKGYKPKDIAKLLYPKEAKEKNNYPDYPVSERISNQIQEAETLINKREYLKYLSIDISKYFRK